jgi:class 3 adenylate cyclase
MRQNDPELPFKIGPMNSRYTPECGPRRDVTVAPTPVIRRWLLAKQSANVKAGLFGASERLFRRAMWSSAMDVGGWLRSLGLEHYEGKFRDNNVDWDVLPQLTADDLKDIGVVAVGDRRRPLSAIAALAADTRSPAALAAEIVAEPARSATPAAPAASAERRQLTVMFCDLVGSTALASKLDPEDLREVIGAYHRCVDDTVHRFGGFVAKYMGDGVLVYFGYPQAHEDDAERAVRSGLVLIEGMKQLDAAERLRVRIGIATGLVIVGDLIGAGAAQEQAVVGETPNLAARLQAVAEPNSVVIAASTRRLIGGLFEYEDLGAVDAKGFAEPVRAWRVRSESTIGSRYEALRSVQTPLVGRDQELDLLRRPWEQDLTIALSAQFCGRFSPR